MAVVTVVLCGFVTVLPVVDCVALGVVVSVTGRVVDIQGPPSPSQSHTSFTNLSTEVTVTVFTVYTVLSPQLEEVMVTHFLVVLTVL